MQAPFKISDNLVVQEQPYLKQNTSILTDIVFPERYRYRSSSKPHRSKYNRVFTGDNLLVMQQLLQSGYRDAFNLIYIDPPYLSQNSYSHTSHVRKGNKNQSIKHTAYSDKFKDIKDYLAMLHPRLLLMRDLLSDTGSIFVHLDYRVSHYVKILLDEVFGADTFRNEIIWCYYGPASPNSRQFNREHQSIFWYSRSPKRWQFFPDAVRAPYSTTTLQKIPSTRNGFSGRKHDFSKGKIPEDWWSDIPLTQRYRHEIVHFETQKPKKLLERIIKSTTKEGDLVGDFFAGSGTTAIVAEELNRKFVTCDTSQLSLKLTRSRLAPILQRPYLVEKLDPQPSGKMSAKISLSKRKLSNKSLTVRIKNLHRHRNNISKKPATKLTHLIDSWAVDWNYEGSVFRASWDIFRGNGKISKPITTLKEYTFRNEVSRKIGIKVVDIFGNETLRLLSFKS